MVHHHSIATIAWNHFTIGCHDITYGSSGLKQRNKDKLRRLELDHLSLPLLLSSRLEVFGPFDGHLVLPLANGALHPEHQLLGGLCLLPQNGLRLTSKALLLSVVPSPSLGLLRLSRFLVLGHLELAVLITLSTVSVPRLRHVHHLRRCCLPLLRSVIKLCKLG